MTNYKEIALEMNRLICGGNHHRASDLLLDAIRNDKHNPNYDTGQTYAEAMNELDRIQKELATLTSEVEKWIETQ